MIPILSPPAHRAATPHRPMLEVLQFIFSSFWIWLGCVILLAAPLAALRHFRD